MVRLFEKENIAAVSEVDKGIKNKCRWEWLEKEVILKIKIGKKEATVTEKLRQFIGKCDVPGKAQCLYCLDLMNYASRGCVALTEHAEVKKHCQTVALRRTNYSLGSGFFNKDSSSKLMSVPSTSGSSADHSSKPLIPLSDRTVQSEALILGVVAENSLPLSMAPVLLNTANELAKDSKALNHVKLDRTTASYKMRFGLAKTLHIETVDAMKITPFSLNIDESTSNNDKRVLTVLVSYFSSEKGMVVVEHRASVDCIKVDALSLQQELQNLFRDHDIPWSNCVSILMDSCNIMRCSKSGLEIRIRDSVAPQLLDVDGDSCHHIHNACKQFCGPFSNWVEYLQSDIHNDIKWSPDLKQYLQEICLLLGIKFSMPERFVSHRWLSCYDALANNAPMNDALYVIYFSFRSKEDRCLYKDIVMKILVDRNVSANGIARVKAIWNMLGEKKLTEDGQSRKKRICQKVIIHGMQSSLISNLYLTVLPLLKEYVCLFQLKEPLVHVLHDKQEQVVRDFLALFMKPEVINGQSAKKLKTLDLSDASKVLDIDQMFVGRKVKDIVKVTGRKDLEISAFYNCAATAYTKCATYMQKKLPLHNELPICMSAIDPEARGHSETAKAMERLGNRLAPFLTEEEQHSLPLEVRRYQVDTSLAPSSIGGRVDVWWHSVISNKRYPALSKMTAVCLSCFHGPMVESSFNTMGDIIDKRSTRMNIATYSSMQTVRYGLKSRNCSALGMFEKKDIKHDPINVN